MRLILVLFLAVPPLMLAACGQFPAVDAAVGPVSQTATYPELVPVALTQDTAPPRLSDTSEDEINARGNRVRRRGATSDD